VDKKQLLKWMSLITLVNVISGGILQFFENVVRETNNSSVSESESTTVEDSGTTEPGKARNGKF